MGLGLGLHWPLITLCPARFAQQSVACGSAMAAAAAVVVAGWRAGWLAGFAFGLGGGGGGGVASERARVWGGTSCELHPRPDSALLCESDTEGCCWLRVAGAAMVWL